MARVRLVTLGPAALAALMLLPCCSSGGKRPGSDPVDSGDSETETEPLIEGEIPGWTMSWIVQEGGPVEGDIYSFNDRATSVATLSDGSTYTTGIFSGTAIFDQGGPNETVLNDEGGSYDGFVAKYSPGGELAWARQIGTPMDASGFEVTVLDDGGGLVAGRTEDETTYFHGAPGETTLTTPAGPKNGFFIARFGADGELIWVSIGGDPEEESWSGVFGIAVVSDDVAVVTGTFRDRLVTNPGTIYQLETESYGDSDIFVAGVSLEDGSIEWVEKAGSVEDDKGAGVVSSNDGSAVVLGKYRGSPLLGEGQPNETQLDEGPGLFLARYGPGGELEWARTAVEGIVPVMNKRTISMTHIGGGFAIATAFSGTAVLDRGCKTETVLTTAEDGEDILLASYSSSGALEWVKHAKWTGEGHSEAITCAISVSPAGRIALSGAYEGEMIFGPGEPQETLLPRNTWAGEDMFLALFEPDGSLEWATSFNGDVPGAEFGDGVEFRGEHTIFFCGRFYGEMVFGTCAEDAVLLEASGSADMFLMRLDETEPPT